MSSGREATVTDHAGLWGPDNIVFGRGSTPVVDKPFRVLVAGTDTLAQLYTDRDRTDTASNPGSTGPLGNVSFYADPGYYDLVVGETTLTVLVPLDPADGGSTGGGGGDPVDDPGVVLSDATPQAPGAAGPGVSVEASRADHRHAPPTAGQIGAATPADIEAAIDAIPGPPTAVFAVADLDMSGGSWTELPGIGLPRMLLVGQPVLVLQGDDRGLWTVTASGPCTPLPDPGGAVIAVTAMQTVASPIVDQMGQPAGWVLVPSAESVLGDLAAETAARQVVDVAVERLRAGGGLDGARWLLVGDHGDGPITWSTPRPVTWTGELVVVADMVPLPPLAGPSSPPVFAEVATCPHASVDFDSPEAAILWTDGRPALFGEAALDGAAEVNLGEDPETRIIGDWGRPGNATHWPEAGEPTAAAGSRGRWLWQWLGDDGAGHRAAGIARPAMPGETPDLTHDGTDWVWILRRVEPGASDIACVGPNLACGLNPGVGTAVASVEWWTGVGGSRFARVHPDDIDGDELVDPHGNTWSSIGATPLLLDRRWPVIATPIT